MKKFFSSPVGTFLITAIGSLIVGVLNYSVRWQKRDHHNFTEFKNAAIKPIIIVWHDQLFAFPIILGLGSPGSCLCSSHSDGRYLGKIIGWFGFHTVWGSSNRKPAAALRAMAREINNGRIATMTPDGPRGPSHVMAMGPIALAQLTGAPIIPVAWRAKSQWRAKSWDKMRFMKPFTSTSMIYGKPIFLEKKKGNEALEIQRQQVENALNELNEQLDREVGL